jgi:hypothetical protein
MIGNDYTGDLTALEEIADGPISVSDNWVNFKLADTDLTVEMKVFADGSTYGIGNGRISKLAIYDDAERIRLMDFHRACETHYDRGWDIKPRTAEAYDRCRLLVETMGARLRIKRPPETTSSAKPIWAS